MSHKYPEIEASLRSMAVNFTVGNMSLEALATRLATLADEVARERDRTRKATDVEAHVLRNAAGGFPLDAGIAQGASTAIRSCMSQRWLAANYTITAAGAIAAGIEQSGVL